MNRISLFILAFTGISLCSSVSAKSLSNENNNKFNAIPASTCTVDFLSVDITNVSNCEDREDGIICVTVNEINPEFELSIDGGLTWTYGESEICREDLLIGEYNIVIRDQGHCEVEYSGNPVTISIDNELVFDDITTTSETYSTLGSITVSVSTGTAPYNYRIDGGTWQSSNEFTDLTEGSYTIEVIDFKGCEISEEVTVVDERCPEFTVGKVIETNCFSPNGIITITTTLGIRPLSYSNDDGLTWQTDSVFNNLSGGSYQLAVKANNGCISKTTTTLTTSFVQISGSSSVVDVSCMDDATGEIHSSSFGGKIPKKYTIDDGITWQASGVFTELISGDYSLIVMDNFGCTDTAIFTITQPTHDTINFINKLDIENCAGDLSGIIALDTELPTPIPPFYSTEATSTKKYSIDNGTTWQSSNTFEDIAAGTYYAIVEEDGCEYEWVNNPIMVLEPDQLIFSSITSTPDNGSSNGEIEITVSGGTGAITYSIDGGSTSQSTGTFTGLDAGIYNLLISDENSCTNDSTFTLEEDTCPVIDGTGTTQNTNCTSPNGTIRILASSEIGGLMYSIDDGATWQSDSLFTGLADDEYNLWVKDGNDCAIEDENNPYILGENFISITGSSDNAECIGDATGAISSTCLGGSGAYEYSIDDGSSWQTGDGDFNDLIAGTYEVIGKDDYGCTDTIEFTINNPSHDTIDEVNIQNILACNGDLTGIISINEALPTTPTPPMGTIKALTSYTYSIDDGVSWQSDKTFDNLPAGEYNAWIKYSGCEYEWAANPIILTEPDPLSFDVITITEDDGSSNGEIEITATGGTGTLQYSANGGSSYQLSNVFSGLAANDYNLVILDEQSCTNDSIVSVPPLIPIVTIPDAIFKAYLVGNSLINTNSDTEIQVSEAEAFNGTITVTGLGISDLTGIEAFITLRYLYCQTNDLTELDISNNTALIYLYCSGNSISELDVSQNSNLTVLSCGGNDITSLNTSNILLKSLYCSNNLITELDLSTNVNLERFFCNRNQIDTLDLSNNSALNTIDCSENNLVLLDIRNGNNNNITSFDATDNDLTCISVSDVTYAAANWTDIDTGVSFSEECDEVPDYETITNTTFDDTDTICFGANLTITVGGDGNTVEFEDESSITLIAGGSISFLPGVIINSGSYVHAYITEDETFCDDLPESIVASDYKYKSIESQIDFTPEINTEIIKQNLKIYPNPNKGLFTVQIDRFTKNTEIFIYNYLGSSVHREILMTEKTIVDLSNMKRGIYFVKAINGNQSNVKRLIIE